MTATMTERAPVEWRFATVSDVRFAERMIDLIVVPYGEETVVEYRGKLITESVLPGAFDGIEGRPGRVTVNRDHDYARTVGIARSFQPGLEKGLGASVRISGTPLGDEALELAADGALGVSIGMAVKATDQRWSLNNTRRHIVKAFVDHIALVPNPAYVGADVLAVRSSGPQPAEELWTPPPTPHLDEVMARLQSRTTSNA